MRTTTLIPAAVIVAALLGGGPETIPQRPQPRSNIERATRLLLSAPPSEAEAKAGLLALLDAVGDTAPTVRIAGDWPARVARARALIEKGPVGDEGAAVLLREGHRQVTGGTEYRFPASVVRLEDALALGRRQLAEAATALEDGRGGDAVHLLLETVLLVITPIEI